MLLPGKYEKSTKVAVNELQPAAHSSYISLNQADMCVSVDVLQFHTHMCQALRWKRAVMNLKSMFHCVLCTAGVKTCKPCPFTSRELKSHVSSSLRGGSCHCAATGLWSRSLSRSLTQSPLRLLSRPPKVSRLPLRCHILTIPFSL